VVHASEIMVQYYMFISYNADSTCTQFSHPYICQKETVRDMPEKL